MADRKEQDVEFLEYVIKSIVDHPDDVKVDRTVDEMGVLLSLTVNPEDMGQIIGRSGATAKSVRTLLRVIGARNNARVNLKIIEPEGSTRGKERREPQEKETTDTAGKTSDADSKEAAIDEAIDDLKI